MNDDYKRTPLYDTHVALGAKMVPFAGHWMPVQYSGVIEEHNTVRSTVGLFDVSHMGEVEFRGPRAVEAVERIITQDLSSIRDGQACYTVMCRESGGIVDDIVVHRFSSERIFVCVNAANRSKDYEWMRSVAGSTCDVVDRSDEFGQIAVQGPKAEALLARLTRDPIAALKRYHFLSGEVAGKPAIIARTGYTGEDGFELYVNASDTVAVWSRLLEGGQSFGVKPAGLGARDSLRLEMRYALYGNDIDDTTNPLEAGLGWVVKLEKSADFVGKEALKRVKDAGLTRKLIGFEVTGRGIARAHYGVLRDGRRVGEVTSGTMGPSVQKAIGMAYVSQELSAIGTPLEIDIRGKSVAAVVVKTPFYVRSGG